MEKKTYLLEINLISAQGLKPTRSLKTYATVHVDPNFKLVSSTRLGTTSFSSPEFLSSETSSVSVSIFAPGFISDQLLGTARLLLIPRSWSIGTPFFSAVQIRSPSGRFQGILNVAAGLVGNLEISVFNQVPAICMRDLGEQTCRRRKKKGSKSDCDFSDGTESIIFTT